MRTRDFGISLFGNTMTAVVSTSLFVWKWPKFSLAEYDLQRPMQRAAVKPRLSRVFSFEKPVHLHWLKNVVIKYARIQDCRSCLGPMWKAINNCIWLSGNTWEKSPFSFPYRAFHKAKWIISQLSPAGPFLVSIRWHLVLLNLFYLDHDG